MVTVKFRVAAAILCELLRSEERRALAFVSMETSNFDINIRGSVCPRLFLTLHKYDQKVNRKMVADLKIVADRN